MDSLKWVKIEGEIDEKAEVVRVQVGETVSDLKHVLYADPVFSKVIGNSAIECILVRGEDGEKVALFLLLLTLQVLSNRDLVDPAQQYEVRLKPVPSMLQPNQF
jgi:hypothetical protein